MATMIRRSVSCLFVLGAAAFAACSAEPPAGEEVGQSTDGVSGAAYTTFDAEQGGCLHGNGNGINCNHYRSKPDVYVNGGPTRGGILPDGWYYFAVLVPGSQNGGFIDGAGGNLSDDDDDDDNRTFRVAGRQIVEYNGTHVVGETPNGKMAISLFPYADTTNNGGVYILAVCEVGATSPRQCKYDAFKVEDEEPVCGDDVVEAPEECERDSDCYGDETCESCVCVAPPEPCCGDGILQWPEECDDGNTVNGDGCSSECICEPTVPAVH